MKNEKYTVFLFNEIPYQTSKALIFINDEQMIVKLLYVPTTYVPLCVLSLLIQIQTKA